MKKLLVVVNKYNDQALDALKCLKEYFVSHNFNYDVYGSWDSDLENQTNVDNYDLAVVLGGDGTMLRTSHFIASKDTPILGINYGHLGFLTNSVSTGLEKLVQDALDGKLDKETRSHLLVDVVTDKNSYEFIALNEACVRRSKSGRIVDFSININKQHVCDLRSDGVIASTATGSTAYALAAGGPLVAPSYKGTIIVPLAPHTLNSRPLVTDVKDVVEFDFTRDAKTDKLAITIDGVIQKIQGKVLRVTAKSDKNETTILRY
ncbi:MAG: NAD(+)/NADH kinase, partial [bacterium]|nr:NAD(+)/NADH kinase [bacterium]